MMRLKLNATKMRLTPIIISLCLIWGCTAVSQTTNIIYGERAEVEPPLDFTQVLWNIDRHDLHRLDTDYDYFFHAITWDHPSGTSNLEGEVVTSVYVLKGEYGEVADGQLFHFGPFYAPEIIQMEFQDDELILVIEYFSERKKVTSRLKLEADR